MKDSTWKLFQYRLLNLFCFCFVVVVFFFVKFLFCFVLIGGFWNSLDSSNNSVNMNLYIVTEMEL